MGKNEMLVKGGRKGEEGTKTGREESERRMEGNRRKKKKKELDREKCKLFRNIDCLDILKSGVM